MRPFATHRFCREDSHSFTLFASDSEEAKVCVFVSVAVVKCVPYSFTFVMLLWRLVSFDLLWCRHKDQSVHLQWHSAYKMLLPCWCVHFEQQPGREWEREKSGFTNPIPIRHRLRIECIIKSLAQRRILKHCTNMARERPNSMMNLSMAQSIVVLSCTSIKYWSIEISSNFRRNSIKAEIK